MKLKWDDKRKTEMKNHKQGVYETSEGLISMESMILEKRNGLRMRLEWHDESVMCVIIMRLRRKWIYLQNRWT